MNTLYGLDLRAGGRLILAQRSLDLVAGLTGVDLGESSPTGQLAEEAILAAFVWAQQAALALWASQQPVDTTRPGASMDYRSTAAKRIPAVAVRLLRAQKDRVAPMPAELVWRPEWPTCYVTPMMVAPGEMAPVGTVNLPLTPVCALRALVKTHAIETGVL